MALTSWIVEIRTDECTYGNVVCCESLHIFLVSASGNTLEDCINVSSQPYLQ